MLGLLCGKMEGEEISPELKASVASLLTWHWMEPLVSLGNKRPLKMEDLYSTIPKDTAAYCENRWNASTQEAKCYEKTWKVVGRFLGKGYFLLPLLRFVWLALCILQVYALKAVVKLVSRHEEKLEWWKAFLSVLPMFLLPVFQSSCSTHVYFLSTRAGIRTKAALSIAIFNKVMVTKISTLGSSDSGRILNIFANDTQKIADFVTQFHFFWPVVLMLPVVSILLVREAGVSTLPGIILICLSQTIQVMLANNIRLWSKKSVNVTDSRIKILREAFVGIHAIKFNGWTAAFLKRIAEVRRVEIELIKRASYLRALMSMFRDGSIPFACLATFGVYVARQGKLHTTTAFAVLAFFAIFGRILGGSCTALPKCFEALVAFERIQKLLHSENKTNHSHSDLEGTEAQESICVEASSCTFSWSGNVAAAKERNKEFKLKEISFALKKGRTIAVTGSVGSGKSSLLLGLLGEMKVLEGRYFAPKLIAYVPQKPWILNDTVRKNILFGSGFDPVRYNAVIFSCGLEEDFSNMIDGDNTEIGERGVNLSGGQKARVSLARACYSQTSVVILDDPFSAVDILTTKHLIQHVLNGLLKERTVICVTHSNICLHSCDEVYRIDNNTLNKLPTTEDSDIIQSTSELSKCVTIKDLDCKTSFGALVKEETTLTGKVTVSSYIHYLQMAGWPRVVAVVCVFVTAQSVFIMLDYWLRAWTDDKYKLSTRVYLAYYASFVAGVTFFSCARAVLFFEAALTAAKNMNTKMTHQLLRSPLLFFDQNPVGRLLTRFSKDQTVADEIIPNLSQSMMELLGGSFGQLVIVAVLMPWFLLAILPFVFIVLYFRQRFTSVCRELRRLESVCSSAVYSHLSETMEGISSIRAYEAEERFDNKFMELIDACNKPTMLYNHATRWLAVRLDFSTTLCVAVAAFLVVLRRDSISPGIAGVILVQSFKLTDVFQFAVRVTAEVENHFTSIERIQEYCHLPSEAHPYTQPGILPEDWPMTGCIEFVNYTLSYRNNLPPVLTDLSFKIKAREKVGIVGRSGAGKSSLVAALFRMVENISCHGYILVDEIDIKNVGLDDLRQRLSIIPQEPVLFSGSVRFNLDPFNKYEDVEIYEALRSTQLFEIGMCGNLDGDVVCDNFSIGERQLLCLARSLLRKCRVVVMDEATASVDNEMDEKVERIVGRVLENSKCTVLTVAHRVERVINSDRVLVLGKGGCVVEFDNPLILLHNTDGIFSAMVRNMSVNK